MKKIFLLSVLWNMGIPCFSQEAQSVAIESKDLSAPDPKIEKKDEKKPSVTRDTISFNSSYFPDQNSNRAINEFMIEFSQGYGNLFSAIDKESGLSLGAGTFMFDAVFGGLVNAFVQIQVAVAAYDFGLDSRFRSLRGKKEFEGGYSNFFSFFGSRLGKIFSDPFPEIFSIKRQLADVKITDEIVFSDDDNQKYKQAMSLMMGGVNNLTYMGDLLVEKAYLHDVHPYTFASHLYSKLLFALGALHEHKIGSGDHLDMIAQLYSASGKSIEKKDMSTAAFVSMLASGSLYSYMWSLHQLKENRSARMKPFEFWGIKVPDTSAYLMSQGISYKVSSGYRYDETLVFPVAFEFVAKGDKAYEATLGFYKEFPQLNHTSIKGDLIISDKGEMGGKLYVEYSPIEYAYVGVGIESYNPKTLHGERNIPEFKDRYNELWLQVGVKY